MRKSGYYWVKGYDGSDWMPAKYDSISRLWTLLGTKEEVTDKNRADAFWIIGPNLIPPDEEATLPQP